MTWLNAQPGRSDLVCWLAVSAIERRNEFFERCLATLFDTGQLTAAQEDALRRAKLRAEIRRERAAVGRKRA